MAATATAPATVAVATKKAHVRQQLIRRQTGILGSVAAFAPNQVSTLKLFRGNDLRNIVLRLQMVTTGATILNPLTPASTSLSAGGAWSIVNKIEIVANSGDVLKTFTGPELKFMNQIWYGPVIETDGFTGGGAGVTIDDVLILPAVRQLARDGWKNDTLIATKLMNDFVINIYWGSINDLTNNGTLASLAFTAAGNPTVTVSEEESYFVDGSTKVYNSWYRRRKTDTGLNNVNAATAYRINLDTKPIYEAITLHFMADYWNDNAAVPDRIRLKSGPTTFFDFDYNTIRRFMRRKHGVSIGQDQSLVTTPIPGTIVEPFESYRYLPKSWLYLDLTGDGGRLSEAIDSWQMPELYLELDTGAAGNAPIPRIDVLTDVIYPANRK